MTPDFEASLATAFREYSVVYSDMNDLYDAHILLEARARRHERTAEPMRAGSARVREPDA